MRSGCCWALALAILSQSCAREHAVQTPPRIRLLTEADASAAASPDVRTDGARRTADLQSLDAVMRVSLRLIAAAWRSDRGPRARAMCWVITMHDDPASVVAFVGGDGRIVVHTGAFRLAETEAGLAALLGHELVHALNQDQPPPSTCTATDAQRPAVYDYEEELHADEAGLTLMADAGYDPREYLRVWERMKVRQKTGDGALEHLTYDRRIEHMGEGLSEALRRYERANRAPQKALPSR